MTILVSPGGAAKLKISTRVSPGAIRESSPTRAAAVNASASVVIFLPEPSKIYLP